MAVPSDHVNRISELATGFALGELTDDELKEFYETLRAPGADGAEAGRLAWETLGVTLDLRAHTGSAFQDELFTHLEASGQPGTAAFAQRVRSRLGHSRPRLQPVDPPESSRQRAWGMILTGVALSAILIGVILAVVLREPPVAHVVATIGSPTLGGRPLHDGDGISRQQIIVPADGQVTLTWKDGSQATLAGPAAALAGDQTLAVLSGRVWCTSLGALRIALPDRREALPLAAGTRLAVELRDNHSLLGVHAGRLAHGELDLGPGEIADLAHTGTASPWQRGPLPRATAFAPGSPHLRWRLDSRVIFSSPDATITLHLRLTDQHVAELRLTPGSLVVNLDGKDLQRQALSGAPLAERELRLSGEGAQLNIDIGTSRLETLLPAAIERVQWEANLGELRDARFAVGPEPDPPVKAPGW